MVFRSTARLAVAIGAVAYLASACATKAQSGALIGAGAGGLAGAGVGAAVGPTLAGSAMELFGPRSLFVYFAIVYVPVAAFAYYRARKAPEPEDATRGQFVPMIRTSAAALEMMSATEPAAEEPPAHSH